MTGLFLVLAISLFCTGAGADAGLQEVIASYRQAHSHNDYEQTHPLVDALDQGFCSIEADIWLAEGEIQVSHNQGHSKGSLKELYLDPLQQRVNVKGSVYGDGAEFFLWIDIKDDNPELNDTLEALISKYPMLAITPGSALARGAVTVILTGDESSKKRHLEKFKQSPVCRDARYSIEDPQSDGRWTWIAIPWSSVSDWRGDGPFQEEDRIQLANLVEDVHRKGRRIRIWGNPDEAGYWQLALDAGIDLINTDRLADLADFLRGKGGGKK
ncbi:MAG: hypothetical protein IPI28_02630 [Candidatus Omnitrophica bacterium]|nr:hypothetical protein [Candidatus Omnitrophota bacterium]